MNSQVLRLESLTFVSVLALGVLACSGEAPAPASEPTPVATVSTAPLLRQTLTETVIAYGTVIPAPGATQTVSVPFECRVRAVLVSPGQVVAAGDPLLEIEPSPDAREQIAQAKNALVAEEALSEATQQRYDLGLAIEDELSQRRQALEDARRRAETVSAWLGLKRPRSPARAIVGATPVSEGALVAAGQPLVELALEHRFEVRLGIEPEDSGTVDAGDVVRWAPLGRGTSVAARGTVRSVARQVSADTRLVDLLVVPTETSEGAPEALLLGEAVRGEIEVQSSTGLVVPRAALVVHGDRWLVYSVDQDRAVEHEVTLGVETDDQVEVLGGGLSAGDQVVVAGNTVLTDGMQVTVGASPAAPSGQGKGKDQSKSPAAGTP
ncbi:MAG: efflux RND transporter periplasmic adaptor subunit [Acidobacteria bacterium]|nr:efflux RND transporter periplasmic adaptor subunit [Acidobacteriota bacterium]